MKPMAVREVREFLRTEQFEQWFQQHKALQDEIVQVRTRRKELLSHAGPHSDLLEHFQQAALDAVMDAGEFDDLSAEAAAELSQIDNESFQALSDFETQRQLASQSWAESDAAEHAALRQRQRIAHLKEEIGAAGDPEAEKLAAELRGLEAGLPEAERRAKDAKTRLVAEEERRDSMWQQVEGTWTEAFRCQMARSEWSYRGRRMRGQAEDMLAQVRHQRAHAAGPEKAALSAAQAHAQLSELEQREAELRGQLETLVDQGRAVFPCTLIAEFLYWPSAADIRGALCVPLINDRDYLNIQVDALTIYQVARSRGLDCIEPLREEGAGSEDDRLDAFFLEPNASVGNN